MESVIDKTPLSENDKVILDFLRQQNMSSFLMDRVISQVNSIKETFKESQVSLPAWGEKEEKEEEVNTNRPKINPQKNGDGPQKNSLSSSIKERDDLEETHKEGGRRGNTHFPSVIIEGSFNVKEKGRAGGKKEEDQNNKKTEDKNKKEKESQEYKEKDKEDQKVDPVKSSSDRRGLLIKSRFPHAQIIYPKTPIRIHLR